MRILWRPFYRLPELYIVVKTWRPMYAHFNRTCRWGRFKVFIVDRDFIIPLLDDRYESL